MKSFVSATNTASFPGPLAFGLCAATVDAADSTRPPEMDRPSGENAPLVRTPTAVKDVGAAVDFILERAYYAKLTNAPQREFIEIPEGTHTVIMEKNRMQLFEAVQAFLDR